MALPPLPKSVTTGSITIPVRMGAEQRVVNTYDFSKLGVEYIEHTLGTGYPGALDLKGKLTDKHEVKLTLDSSGSVRMSGTFSKNDPEQGPYQDVDTVRELTDLERASLAEAMRARIGTDPMYERAVEFLTGKAPKQSAHAGGVSRQLQPDTGAPLAGGKGIYGGD